MVCIRAGYSFFVAGMLPEKCRKAVRMESRRFCRLVIAEIFRMVSLAFQKGL